MTARSEMADVISRVRTLIHDTGASPHFTDEEIQNALDDTCSMVDYMPLDSNVDGTKFSAGVGMWEKGAVLKCGDETVTYEDANFDAIRGVWSFDTAKAGLTVTGQYYDVYAAAADLLEAWAAAESGKYDFSADGASYHRSQSAAMKLKLAEKYLEKARPVSIDLVRTDV